MQLPWHKPYSQIPKQPAAYGSLAVPILSRSFLGGAAEKAGCTNNNTVCSENLNDRNQMNKSCTPQIYGAQQQQQEHSTMAHSFNLPNSIVIDCTANEKEVANRLIYLPQATDRFESGSRNPRRFAPDAISSTVSRENSPPVNASRCTSSIGGEGRPLNSFNSPELGDKLDFYSANNDSLTDGEAEESVLDLSSSPDEGSESSDDGLFSDSPSSSIDEEEKESHKIARPVSCTGGGIAEGMRLGQIADGGAAVTSECVSCLTLIPGAPPPPTTRRNEGDSSGRIALLPLDIDTEACCEGEGNTCQVLSNAATLYPAGDLKRIIGQSGCPIQQCTTAEQRAFSASCDVSPIDRWSDRGKENVDVNSDAHRTLGCSVRLDLKLQPHSVTVCTAEKEKIAYGTGAVAGAGTGLPHHAVSQGEKRKLYDTVAIMSDSRGGRGKRPKSSMRVASIKSFFAPR